MMSANEIDQPSCRGECTMRALFKLISFTRRKCQARENKRKMHCALTHLMPVWPSRSPAPHIIVLGSGNLSSRAASIASSPQSKTVYKQKQYIGIVFLWFASLSFHIALFPYSLASYVISRASKGCFSSKLPLWRRYLCCSVHMITQSQLKDLFSLYMRK